MVDNNDNKNNLSGKLQLKKTINAGQIKQSFSHGRSRSVSVEVKKKRSLTGFSKDEKIEQPKSQDTSLTQTDHSEKKVTSKATEKNIETEVKNEKIEKKPLKKTQQKISMKQKLIMKQTMKQLRNQNNQSLLNHLKVLKIDGKENLLFLKH